LSGSGTEVKGTHILDPRTGEPAEEHLAVWVSHPSATVADALSTAFMVMSPDEVTAYTGNDTDVWALVVDNKRECRVLNPGLFENEKN
jgi:thiamine biosynthesis lipoprotein